MRYIVKRWNPESGRVGYTGPMRTLVHAERECAAWNDPSWVGDSPAAEVIEFTPEVRAAVRAWQREADLRLVRV